MAQIVTRMYANASDAALAANELKASRFPENDVVVCAPAPSATTEEILATLSTVVPRSDAPAYVEGLKKGQTLVAVQAPFGSGRKAEVILEKHKPVASPAPAPRPSPTFGVAAGSMTKLRYDDGAPLSNALQWQTKLEDATPLSRFFNLPTLSDFSLSKQFGFGELMDDAAPLSKRFGWEVLRDDPTPLSDKFKWPVLRD